MKKETTGQYLKKCRLKAGKSQIEIAKYFSWTQPVFVHLIENGKSKLPLDIASEYCEQVGANKEKVVKLLSKEAVQNIFEKVLT